MTDKLEVLDDLVELQRRDLYSSGTQLVRARPLMAEKARNSRLRACFTKHLHETEKWVLRLKRIGEDLGLDLSGHTCRAMAAFIAAAQRSEHSEMAGHGTAAHYAERLKTPVAADLLRQTLEEEKIINTKIKKLPKSYFNQKAE